MCWTNPDDKRAYHRRYNRERRAVNRARGICQRCGDPSEKFNDCQACRVKNAARHAARRRRMKAAQNDRTLVSPPHTQAAAVSGDSGSTCAS
jgi:hypothetical protein